MGRDGDFYTNVSVGSLFGELLAFQFAEWLEEMQPEEHETRIVEAGAHNGQLAHDVLSWLMENRPQLLAKLKYVLVEPSSRRREWQQRMLGKFSNVHWLPKLENSPVRGIIFSNELLDAMPVHRFGWDAKGKKWFEWGVALDGDELIWARVPDPPAAICPPQLETILPDGYTIEINSAAENWWRVAADLLSAGKLLTIDYGLTETELFSPARHSGTLRSYRSHRFGDNVLSSPGEQDITAHVNFSAIQAIGEKAGLKTEGLFSQPQFLVRIVERMTKANPALAWTSSRVRQLQTLTHPEHLGHAFRVLIQSRK